MVVMRHNHYWPVDGLSGLGAAQGLYTSILLYIILAAACVVKI